MNLARRSQYRYFQFCERIKESNNNLSSKFSRGFLGDKIFLDSQCTIEYCLMQTEYRLWKQLGICHAYITVTNLGNFAATNGHE